jgi:hypothetical protein
MPKTVEIGYLSSTDQDYSRALKKVKSLAELKELVNYYAPLTEDAIAAVNTMNSQEFVLFKEDSRRVETASGKEAERIVKAWGEIFVPSKMMKVSMTAINFGAPFGTAYIRMKEMGAL